MARESIAAVLAPRARRRRCSTSCSSTSATCRAASTTTPSTSSSASELDEFDEEAGIAVQPALLPLDRADVLPHDRRASSASTGSNKRTSDAEVRVVIEKPFGTRPRRGARAEPAGARACSTSRRSSASTTTWARRPSRTCSRFGSRTASSSRSGTATTSTTCRSPRPRTSGSARARRLLRHGGRAARPGPEPHAAAADAAVHGAAGDASPPTTCATRRSRSCTRSTPPTPEQVEQIAVRGAVRGGHRRRARSARLPRGGGRAAATRRTETYVALRLEVDNWRWAGVPFYLRTGKRLARKVTEIAVTLKPVPHLAFDAAGLGRRAAEPARADDAAERGRVALARGEDPRHAHARSGR